MMMQPMINGPHGEHEEQMDAIPTDVLDRFYANMSLALDGLLDEADAAAFDADQAAYPALAALWLDWQTLDQELEQLPHAAPAPGFVGRFEGRLARQEAAQQQRVLAFSVVSIILVASLAVAGIVGGVAYLTSTQGPWLGQQIHSLVLLSATGGAWLDAVFGTLAALTSTPEAQALGTMYMLVALVMIFGWVQLLRRSARLTPAVALPPME